jgi:hypothetical protein
MTAKLFLWDWKQQPDMDAVAAAVMEVSEGTVIMREFDTGGDNYCWVISDHPVTDYEAEQLYRS